MKNKIIPIYFASDKNYLPYLTVAVKSLIDHANSNADYRIYILTDDLTIDDITEMKSFEKPNTKVEIVNVHNKIESIKNKLALRDYYSVSIYFRLFIPSLFPQYNKAIYLDSDIILNRDIAEMFNVNIGIKYLGAVLDETVYSNKDFIYYVNEALDVSEKQYFNSGVLLMNLAKFRQNNIEEDFYKWVNNYQFGAVAPDQDYLNITCKNSVKYLDLGWNKMPMCEELPSEKLHLIHYNMFMKPWKYENIMFEDYFWKYAKQTSFYDFIKDAQKNYSQERKDQDKNGLENLLKLAINIANSDNNYKHVVLKKGEKKTQIKLIDYEDEQEDVNDEDILDFVLPSAIKTNHKK